MNTFRTLIKKPALLTLLALLAGMNASSADGDGLSFSSPKIRSTYRVDRVPESAPISSATVTGSGFVGQVGNRYFFISDSHLSQGELLEILTSYEPHAEPLQPKNSAAGRLERLADNDHDLEIIELEKPKHPMHPLFIYNSTTGDFELEEDKNPARKLSCIQIARGLCAIMPPSVQGKPTSYDPRNQSLDDSDPRRTQVGVTFGLNLDDMVVDSRIVQGMSGTPLLMTKARPAIAGLAKAYHRRYSKSYFSTIMQINDLLKRFLTGERGFTSPTRWKFRKGISTYRDYGNGTLEINPDLIPSGGGEGGDGGLSTNAGHNATDGGSTLAALGVRAGMLWRNQPILGFEVGKKSEGRFIGSLQVYGNRAGELFTDDLMRAIPGLTREPISPEIQLVELLKQRLAKVGEASPKSAGCFIDEKALARGMIRIKVIKPRIQGDPSPPSERPEDWKNKFYTLELNSNGIQKDAENRHFEPLIEVRTVNPDRQTPQTVLLDIKGLFFMDASQAEQSYSRPDNGNPTLGPSSFIDRFSETPYVTFPPIEGLRDVAFACAKAEDPRFFEEAENPTRSDCQPEENQRSGLLSPQNRDELSSGAEAAEHLLANSKSLVR